MEKKYYTPTIEEFHVGFECEVDVAMVSGPKMEHGIAQVDEIDTGHYFEYHLCVNGTRVYEGRIERFRVKYLDIEDIESLGWKNHVHSSLFYFDIPNVTTHSGEYFLNDELIGYPDYEMVFEESNKITIRDCERDVIFCGTIRNKSELKKLMQQLQIKQLNIK